MTTRSVALLCILLAASAGIDAPEVHVAVRADQTLHPLSRDLTGACLEDVNHEVDGGLYSQMVFGESFQEPPMTSLLQDFQACGGIWRVQGDELHFSGSPGDKLVSECGPFAEGEVGVDVFLAGQQRILQLARQHNREVWFDLHVGTDGPRPDSTLEGMFSFTDALGQMAAGATHKVAVFEFNAGNHSHKRAHPANSPGDRVVGSARRREHRRQVRRHQAAPEPRAAPDQGWNHELHLPGTLGGGDIVRRTDRAIVHAETLTLPLDQRPAWLRQEGIVMAGSWEPLLFRVRRDGGDGYEPTPEQRDAYRREHSPEMVAQLKALGVNFVMMHCYKGAGLAAERESMADAVRFARLCHDAGLHVGVYAYSGAFLWEPLFQEVPQARDWVLYGADGKPRTYDNAGYRYYWNRNHPAAQAFYRQIVSFAVRDIQTDLLHFDNYIAGPGYDQPSIARFRQYLRDTFSPARLQKAGLADINVVEPPRGGASNGLLRRAWLDFCCQSLAGSYQDIGRYARTLRRDILLECNPDGPGNSIRPPVDHGRVLPGGEAFWDEGRPPGYRGGQLHTRIRTYKIARGMNNMAFTYVTTPLEMAESLAFNLDCLGCICWFEYGRIVTAPGSKTALSSEIAPFVRFFHDRRDLFRDAHVVADVAALRSFPSQVFADSQYADLTYRVEQALIDDHACFQIIYDQQLDSLRRYRALVLAGCIALSDRQIESIRQYVASGGHVCIIGPAATHDAWLTPRPTPALDDLPASRVEQTATDSDILSAIHRACGNQPSLRIRGNSGLASELTGQPGRHLIHLVNYRPDPALSINVSLRLPQGAHPQSVTLISPQQPQDRALPFEVRDGSVEFRIPEVKVYEIALVRTHK